MPCMTYSESDKTDQLTYRVGKLSQTVSSLEKNIARLEAVLCGVMQADPSIVDRIDWKEVGVAKQAHMKWWQDHQLADAERRAKEAREKAEKAEARRKKKEKAARDREARKEELRKELAKLEAEDAKRAAKT